MLKNRASQLRWKGETVQELGREERGAAKVKIYGLKYRVLSQRARLYAKYSSSKKTHTTGGKASCLVTKETLGLAKAGGEFDPDRGTDQIELDETNTAIGRSKIRQIL